VTILDSFGRALALHFTSDYNTITNSDFSDTQGVILSGSSFNLLKNVQIDKPVASTIVISSPGATPMLSEGNILERVVITEPNGSAYDIRFNGGNGVPTTTFLVDTFLGKYFFFGEGNKIVSENTQEGEIKFLDFIEGLGLSLKDEVRIGNNLALIDASVNPGLDRRAEITLKNIAWTYEPLQRYVLRNGVLCPDNMCEIIYVKGNEVKFRVPGAGVYSIV